MDRRRFLAASAFGAASLAEDASIRSANASESTTTGGSAQSTILIWLSGGPSHIDLWDMKPDAPAEVRGEFRPVSTSASSIRLCEHLPHLAFQSHHLALVRSLGQRGRGPNDHHPGYYYNLTGHPAGPVFPNSRVPLADDWPFLGSVVAAKKPAHQSLPSHIWLPARPEHPRPGSISARLGPEYDPLLVQGSHAAPLEFAAPSLTLEGDVSVARMQQRNGLLNALEAAEQNLERKTALRDYGKLQQRAFSLLTSPGTKNAFDLSQESEAVRSRYGATVNALSMLMARRLVEAGVPFVTVYWYHDYEEDKRRGCLGGAWDTHWKNFSCLRDYLLPQFDQPFSALLADLEERGLLEQTLVLVTSEMGRTPKLGDPRSGGEGAAEPGRDHWTHCQTALLAGGGVRGGQVYGSSDRIAAYPSDKPVGPEHIAHTVYHAMGIRDLSARDYQDRPYQLLEEGEPLTSLF